MIWTATLVTLLVSVALAQDDGPRITGQTKYEPHALVRLKAEGVPPKSAIMWRISPSKGTHKATTPRGLLEFSAHPGDYEVTLLVISQMADGGLDVIERSVTVTIAGCSPVPPGPVPPTPPGPNPPVPPTPPGGGKLHPVNALAQVRFALGGGRYGACTTTVIYPQRSDGRWDLLCAAHCMPGVGAVGEVRMKDGRQFTATTRAHDPRCDLAWLVTDQPVQDLPYAILAANNPAPGTPIWHMGYGVDRPGNREDGTVTGGEDSNGQLPMRISVSSGDSGGGLLRSDNNEVISAVCCTMSKGAVASVWGGSCRRAWQLRPKVGSVELLPSLVPGAGWDPVEIPVCRDRTSDNWDPVEIPVRSAASIQTSQYELGNCYRPQDGVSLKGR